MQGLRKWNSKTYPCGPYTPLKWVRRLKRVYVKHHSPTFAVNLLQANSFIHSHGIKLLSKKTKCRPISGCSTRRQKQKWKKMPKICKINSNPKAPHSWSSSAIKPKLSEAPHLRKIYTRMVSRLQSFDAWSFWHTDEFALSSGWTIMTDHNFHSWFSDVKITGGSHVRLSSPNRYWNSMPPSHQRRSSYWRPIASLHAQPYVSVCAPSVLIRYFDCFLTYLEEYTLSVLLHSVIQSLCSMPTRLWHGNRMDDQECPIVATYRRGYIEGQTSQQHFDNCFLNLAGFPMRCKRVADTCV